MAKKKLTSLLNVDEMYLTFSMTMLSKSILVRLDMDLLQHLVILSALSIWTFVMVKVGLTRSFFGACDFLQ